ncbi:RDD family protein [Wolbachia endosymbiont (group B) of Longitarsus flavicornis]|uniref:RDD family protein n=1 Tax=Wolbachia endosymbiont (group B) of Longitarsus flavicornis TaxID=3066135 RepID=UPI00333F78E7
MDTETGVKVNYAKITKRVTAYVVDQIIFLAFYLFILFMLSGKHYADFFSDFFSDTKTAPSVQNEVLEALIYIVLEVLMIIKLGCTPGKLLCGIYIKDANTPKNVALMQGVIRSTFKVFLWVPCYISGWFFILPIFVLIFAVFDRRKQTFYDKIAKTVVYDKTAKKTEECHLNLNYVGITRRVIAYIIDLFIIIGISLVFFSPAKMAFDPDGSKLLAICLCFLLSIIFGVFMVRRFSGTPGQLLCCICIKDANTFENITLVQATIRYVLFKVPSLFVLSFIVIVGIIRESLDNPYEWWFLLPVNLVSITIIIAIILIFIYAVFNQRKQFFYDRITKTVAIDYKPS